MDRTVKIQLHPTPEQAQALRETLEQFTSAFNAVVAYGWQHKDEERGEVASRDLSCYQSVLCRQCGYQLNADFNASLNIRNKYVASLASLGTPMASAPLSSGVSSQSSD